MFFLFLLPWLQSKAFSLTKNLFITKYYNDDLWQMNGSIVLMLMSCIEVTWYLLMLTVVVGRQLTCNMPWQTLHDWSAHPTKAVWYHRSMTLTYFSILPVKSISITLHLSIEQGSGLLCIWSTLSDLIMDQSVI